jgi:DNA mismatch endonuclease, patch repair protein
MCADIVSPEKRAEMMSRIKGKNSVPELRVRKQLFGQGLRYRLHRTDLPGSPDIVLPRYRVAIFVHGCFWHRHGCKYTSTPATRPDFWADKFKANVERDKRAVEQLLALGWRVAVVWECCVGRDGLTEAHLIQLAKWIQRQATRATRVLELP